MRQVPTKIALDSKRNRFSQWTRAEERLAPEVWPEVKPSFQISQGGKIFTIGSCFARNIEEHLDRLGYDVPTLGFAVPKNEWSGRGNGILNKYTPAAIWQEVNWAAQIYERDRCLTEHDCAVFAFQTKEKVVDMNLGGFVPVSEARFFERRKQLYETFEHAFSAECVTLTLGLIEAWFDLEKQIYVQKAPVSRDFRLLRDRFAFRVLSYEDCLGFMQDTIDTIRRLNPAVNFLLTTSPVPLERTFTDDDVITANMYSKCLLRSVCGELVASNEGVDYFPSFESVMLTKSWDIWYSDRLHVSDSFVGRIVSRLVETYFSEAGTVESLYQEAYTEQAARKHESALALANEAIELDSNRPEIWSLAAHSYGTLERHREAIDAIRRAIELAPHMAEYQLFLANMLHEDGELDKALNAMADAIERAPAVAEYRAYYSELLAVAGDVQHSLAEAKQAVELDPHQVKFQVRLGRALSTSGQAEEAHACCRTARDLAQQNPYGLRMVAELFAELGELAEARECLESARKNSPHRKFRKSISDLMQRLGQLEQSA
jgi:tetratricopeptide (TPR) repeat protein